MLSPEPLHLVVSHEPARCEDAGVGAPGSAIACSITGLSLETTQDRRVMRNSVPQQPLRGPQFPASDAHVLPYPHIEDQLTAVTRAKATKDTAVSSLPPSQAFLGPPSFVVLYSDISWIWNQQGD